MADGWAYYDADGKRVPPGSSQAAFRGKEFSADSGVPAPSGHASLGRIEYRDVHAIGQPDVRMTFKSRSKMRAWFKEHARDTGKG